MTQRRRNLNRALALFAFVVALTACVQTSAVLFLSLLGVSTFICAYLFASDVFRYRRDARVHDHDDVI